MTGLYSHAWYKSSQAAVHFCWHGNILSLLINPGTDKTYELLYRTLLEEVTVLAEPTVCGLLKLKCSYGGGKDTSSGSV